MPADFKGKVVVLNIWATWCGPCKTEMPTLAKLAQAYAGKPVEVVAISIDKPDALAEAKAFIAANAPLKLYNDPDAKLPWTLKPNADGMPTTIILGKDGLERGPDLRRGRLGRAGRQGGDRQGAGGKLGAARDLAALGVEGVAKRPRLLAARRRGR